MKSEECNNLLLKAFPQLNHLINEEMKWQEGYNTGSHIIYGDVFTPYIEKCILGKNIDELNKAFQFIENLLNKEDTYLNEVVSFSILESIQHLLTEHEVLEMLGLKTQKLLMEIVK